jgi:hypothetical protein
VSKTLKHEQKEKQKKSKKEAQKKQNMSNRASSCVKSEPEILIFAKRKLSASSPVPARAQRLHRALRACPYSFQIYHTS